MSHGYEEEPREDAKSAGMPGGHPSQATYVINPSGMSGYPPQYPTFGPQAQQLQANVLNMPNRPESQVPVPRPPHYYHGPTYQGHIYSHGNWPQGMCTQIEAVVVSTCTVRLLEGQLI